MYGRSVVFMPKWCAEMHCGRDEAMSISCIWYGKPLAIFCLDIKWFSAKTIISEWVSMFLNRFAPNIENFLSFLWRVFDLYKLYAHMTKNDIRSLIIVCATFHYDESFSLNLVILKPKFCFKGISLPVPPVVEGLESKFPSRVLKYPEMLDFARVNQS